MYNNNSEQRKDMMTADINSFFSDQIFLFQFSGKIMITIKSFIDVSSFHYKGKIFLYIYVLSFNLSERT